MLSRSLQACWLAALVVLAAGGEPAFAQGTQLGSNSGGRGARLAQYDGAVVDNSGGMMPQPEMVVQPGGGDVWGDDAYEQQGWSSNLFGVPCGQSCQGRGAGFIAGGGVYYIKPMWTNNQGGLVVAPNAAGGTTASRFEIDNDHEWAPFVFLGFVGPNGFGVRGRAWYYDQAANSLTFAAPVGGLGASQSPLSAMAAINPALPFPFPIAFDTSVPLPGGSTMTVASSLTTYVYDLEAIQQIDYEQWTWTFSGGVRYAIIRQEYNATRAALGIIAAQSVTSLHEFSGWGPTLSLEGRRAFGQTGLAFYGNARGSLLFGGATQTVTQSEFRINNNFIPPVVVPGNTASAERWSVRPIIELEIGGEYGYWLGTTARLFARAGLVGQAWFNAGNAANAGLTTLADDNANMGFTGYRATVGVDY